MSTDQTQSSYFPARALEHATRLAKSPRGSTTNAEKQAAEYVQSQLDAFGIKDIHLQSFSGLRSIWLFSALAFGLALVGHAAFWLLRGPIGSYPALLISLLAFGLSAAMLWRKFTYRDYPLKNSVPYGPSQNVIGVVPPASEVHQRVVLVGHLDSHRAVFWFATNFLLVVFSISFFLSLLGVFLAIPLYALAILTHLQLFAWIGLGFALLHFLAWFSGVTADLGKFSPGANDNASGMGTILALAERLKDHPLQHTELWLAFTGCEESGCDGILALIHAHEQQLRAALFIDLETVGIGDHLVYIHDEGNIHRRSIPPEVESMLKEVGQPFGLHSVSMPRVGAYTEGGVLWEYGFKAACLTVVDEKSRMSPEWHRLTDTPDRLQVASLERIQALVWACLQRLDGGWGWPQPAAK